MGNLKDKNKGVLSEEQLTLLSSFIYLEGVAIHGTEDVTVGKVVEMLLDNNGTGLDKSRTEDPKKYGTIGEYPALISRDGWLDILKAIEADEQLCKLTITHPVDFRKDAQLKVNGKDITAKDGFRAATFVDKTTKNATVVFRGTSTPSDWRDNLEALIQSDTAQQLAAKTYVENIPEYNHLTSVGHSKGGNNSEYAFITTGKIHRCYSIDGQGFSWLFYNKYKDTIDAKGHKITAIRLDNDYVHGLLTTIAGVVKYIKCADEKIAFPCFHATDQLLEFQKDGDKIISVILREQGEQGMVAKIIHDFSMYAMENLEIKEVEELIDTVMVRIFRNFFQYTLWVY